MSINLRTKRSKKLKELVEYYCGFRGSNYALLELEEELEKLFKEQSQ